MNATSAASTGLPVEIVSMSSNAACTWPEAGRRARRQRRDRGGHLIGRVGGMGGRGHRGRPHAHRASGGRGEIRSGRDELMPLGGLGVVGDDRIAKAPARPRRSGRRRSAPPRRPVRWWPATRPAWSDTAARPAARAGSPSGRPMRRVSRYSARECVCAPASVSRSWSPHAIRPSQASDIVGVVAVISVKTLSARAMSPPR